MAAKASSALAGEIGDHIAPATPERRATIFRRMIDLFRLDAHRFNDSQIEVFDDVFVCLVEQESDRKTLAQASLILSEIATAPPNTIRMLAFHADASVAAPVLANSNRIVEQDLIQIATNGDRDRLSAIKKRKTLSRPLADLVTLRMSSPRLDVPAGIEKQTAKSSTTRPSAYDYSPVRAEIKEMARTGKLGDSSINRFAVRQQYTHVILALAALVDVDVDRIEPLMEGDRIRELLTACKSARLDWSTARTIVSNRPGCAPISKDEMEEAREFYDGKLLSLAQWATRFG